MQEQIPNSAVQPQQIPIEEQLKRATEGVRVAQSALKNRDEAWQFSFDKLQEHVEKQYKLYEDRLDVKDTIIQATHEKYLDQKASNAVLKKENEILKEELNLVLKLIKSQEEFQKLQSTSTSTPVATPPGSPSGKMVGDSLTKTLRSSGDDNNSRRNLEDFKPPDYDKLQEKFREIRLNSLLRTS